MSRITAVFERLRREERVGLVTYATAGDPDLEQSTEILLALDGAGADVIEVGVPFSDPLADGPVIQRATERALRGGTTLRVVLDLVAGLRSRISAPIVIFSYANPLMRMGLDQFTLRAAAAGVDGVLVLDLPIEEALEFRSLLAASSIDAIFLISPTTTDARLKRAAELGSGFLYAISRLGVTGSRDEVASGAEGLVRRIRAQSTMPVALGFGLSRPEHIAQVATYADAAVVGSALVSVIADHAGSTNLAETVQGYVRWLKSGVGSRPAVRRHAEV
jgi:tryptophan synthase alpha chain